MAFGFRGAWGSTYGGCDGQADTPDPIPNSEVKRPGGENTLAGKIAAAAFFVVPDSAARPCVTAGTDKTRI